MRVSIATVTANPAIDVSASVDEVLPFHKLRCGPEKRHAGGGGINIARVLHRWNADVTAIFPAGGITGELLKQLVDQEGIRRCVIDVAGDTREDITIFETGNGNQFRFVFPGAALSERELRACCDALAAVTPKPTIVVASGSLPPGAPTDFFARVLGLAKRLGARPVIDSSGAALSQALEEGVYLAKPNLRELSQLVGRSLTQEAEWLDAGRELVMAGKAEILTLTLGEKGALAVTREAAWRAHAPAVQAVSTVGAGDSFLGAMILRLSHGADIAEALRYAVAAGTAALLAPGTELARPAETDHLLSSVRVERVA
jgi:6-phosphofructokinase 2